MQCKLILKLVSTSYGHSIRLVLLRFRLQLEFDMKSEIRLKVDPKVILRMQFHYHKQF